MSQTSQETPCPGCGLTMPPSDTAVYDGYFNTSPGCWSLFTEVIGSEFGNAVLFRQVHQLTVDAYAVQHAGGPHPDKSVDVHLCGLHLVLERDVAPTSVAGHLQRLAGRVEVWPHFEPPVEKQPLSVWDVAFAGSPQEHADTARKWARSVWNAWATHHEEVGRFLRQHLDLEACPTPEG